MTAVIGHPTRLDAPETTPASRAGDPAWTRPAVFGLLAATAVLYLWGLSASGWANSFYSAAAQAGSVSWKAFLFGSSDAANSITVDKTPLSLWPMGFAIRVFGLNSWSILVPQAIQGVAAVGLLYLTVKRWFGASAGLLAGGVFATTPVAVLMFRFNNPDAMLVLLLVASAYFLTRAVEDGRTRWMAASGAMIGLGFLAKELQAFVLLPILVGTYLVAGPPALGRRLLQTVWLGLGTLVAGGWWVLLVSLWPASSRPYFGGSQDNTFFNVLFGYNGLGRLTGDEAGSVVPGGGRGARDGMWGATGLTRLFNDSFGGQASWLMPAALLVLAAGLVWRLRQPRTDRTRAALLLWGGWLVLTGLVFSLSKGIIHEYYTVALAPAIGALVGIGAAECWRHRDRIAARGLLAAAVALSAAWSFVLLGRSPDFVPRLRWEVVAAGAAAVAIVLLWGRLAASTTRWAGALAAGLSLVVALAGPTAYALETAATPHTGSLPSAGPAASGARGGPGGFGRPGSAPRGMTPPAGLPGGSGQFPDGGPSDGGFPGRYLPGGFPDGGFPGGGAPQMGAPGSDGGGRSGAGSLLEGSSPGVELTALLKDGGSRFDWVAATVGANSAAGYQLATGLPVMPIGGFNGSDPSPTLAQFRQYVQDGRIGWFISGGMGGRGGGPGGGSSGSSSEIAQWVTENFTSTTVDGVTLYDLNQPKT